MEKHDQEVRTYNDLTGEESILSNTSVLDNNKQSSIEFIQWVLELFPPQYDMDSRRRFTPQIEGDKTKPDLWIETHRIYYVHKFYTTEQLYDLWLQSKSKSETKPQ